MKNNAIQLAIIIMVFLLPLTLLAQERVTISGKITDKTTAESLIGVSVYIKELKSGATTNEYGFYSLTVPKGKYDINIAYIGYTSQNINLNLIENVKQDISLLVDQQVLTEVIVSGEKKSAEIRRPEMSVNRLSAREIKQMPVILGEVDVIKSILQLPGVTSAGEGQSGFNVRGGSADQNLVLLDEATIYNSSHLFGFFSVFNADAINDIKLYKGGIPARFGGRLSSVLDIYQKEGNKNKFGISGGIGLVSSRLMAEGPINNGKGSYLLAGRGSYAHLFLKFAYHYNFK